MKHVLLLAMSTINFEPEEYSFKLSGNDDEKIIGKYWGQLEPVAKYIMHENKKDDLHIIVLCTKETKKPGKWEDKIAYDYFVSQMSKYKSEIGFEGNLVFDDPDYDDDAPQRSISKTVELVRKNFEVGVTKLWIETHGGPRNLSLTMEAIISLLKVDGIVPYRVMGIKNFDRKKTVQEIADQKEAFDMFEFVSGMNEFINYGSVRGLDEYYGKNKTEYNEVKSVITAMEAVSNAVQECNPGEYPSALTKLGKELDRLPENNTMLSIFKDYIKEDYGVLLYEGKRSTIDIIERCRKKGLTQQALTFLETLMPKEMFERGILTCDKSELNNLKNNDAWAYYLDDASNAINIFITSKKEKDKQPVFLDFNSLFKSHGVPGTVGKEAKNKFIDSFKQFDRVMKSDDFPKLEKEKMKYKSVVVEAEKAEAAKLLYLHAALKNCRNKFNHCDQNRPNIEKIEYAIDEYIRISKRLFSKYPRKFILVESKKGRSSARRRRQ